MEGAKIYRLVSDKTDKVYYGSTCKTLANRWYNHKALYNGYLNGRANKTRAFEIISLDQDDFKLELVEDCSWCWDRFELRSRERYYIENFPCVNKNIPNRTHKECTKAYYQKNKDTLLVKRKEYYDSNREDIIKKTRQYHLKNIDKYQEYQKQYQTKYRADKKAERQESIKNI